MNNKRTKIIILVLIILLIAVGIVVTISLLGKEDKGTAKGNGTTEVVVSEEATAQDSTEKATEEPTTEVATTEKPSAEEPDEPKTEGTTEAPKQETTEAPAKPEPTPSAPQETTEAPKPEKPEPKPESTTEAPAQPSAPKHEHSWVWVETKPASKVWVVDQAAWTETVEYPAQYDEIPAVQCKYCGEKFTTADAFWAHKEAFKGINSDHSCGGSRDAWIYVLVQEAYTETIEHPEVGHWEETPAEGHYECDCGATK